MKKIILSAVLMLAAVGVMPIGIFGADIFDFNYSLTEGGFRLELTPATLYKGVKIEVNTNISKRYEVVQRLVSPLVSNDNPNIQLRDNFVFRGVRGSNKYGNFRVPTDDSPVRGDETLYISNDTGEPDNFTLIFGIVRPEDVQPGRYSGRVSFTLNPVGAAVSPVTRVLDVYVSISEEEGLAPKIEIRTATGSKTIRINPRREELKSQDVAVVKNGSFKNMFSIIQYLSAPLQSAEGLRLDEGALKFMVSRAQKGVSINQPTSVSGRPDTVYSSGPNGDADDTFIISYTPGDLSLQKAGVYRSRIQYFLEQQGRQQPIDAIEIELENERVFDFAITLPQGGYNIEFPGMKAGEPPRISEVDFEVISNVGKQYQVSQDVYAELRNKEGEMIPSRYFTVRTDYPGGSGKAKLAQKQEVKKGSTVLFVSDAEGSPDKLKVVYELECPKDVKAGDYSTRITYSLVEI